MQNLKFTIRESKRQCNPISHLLSSMNGLVLQISKKSFALWMCVGNFRPVIPIGWWKITQEIRMNLVGKFVWFWIIDSQPMGWKEPLCMKPITTLELSPFHEIRNDYKYLFQNLISLYQRYWCSGFKRCLCMRSEGAWIFHTKFHISAVLWCKWNSRWNVNAISEFKTGIFDFQFRSVSRINMRFQRSISCFR